MPEFSNINNFMLFVVTFTLSVKLVSEATFTSKSSLLKLFTKSTALAAEIIIQIAKKAMKIHNIFEFIFKLSPP